MSKVKFIQWGTPDDPKTYAERWASEGVDSTIFKNVLDTYQGGIIFVTYTDKDNKQAQEIWANGVRYSVGGDSTGNIIYGTSLPDPKTGKVVISGKELVGTDGSVYVYKSADHQTAYYWDQNKWNPFNVDAANVWFHEDITLAGNYTSIGNFSKGGVDTTASLYTKLGLASGETDFSLKTLITKLLSEVVFPTPSTSNASLTSSVTAPSITSSTTGVSNNAILDIGTKIGINAVTANGADWSGQEYTQISGLTYGYSTDGVNATSTNKSLTSENYATPTLTGNTTYSLTYETVSGFSTLKVPSAASNAAAASCQISAISDVTVDEGKNTIKLTETGRSHTTTTKALSSVYITSNVGTWDSSKKTEAVSSQTLTSTAPTDSSTFTVYGVTPIYSNGSATSGDTYSEYNYTPTVNKVSNSTVYTVSNNAAVYQSFKLGFAGNMSGDWVIYIPAGHTISAVQYNSGSGKFDAVRAFKKVTSSDKTGYDKYVLHNESTAGNGTVLFTLSTT